MKLTRFFFSSLLIGCCLLLSGCMTSSQPAAILYDLGPDSSMPTGRQMPADMPLLAVSQVESADWLDNNKMYYRLAQVNDQQTRYYTLSLWNMQPQRLFRERLTSRIISAGGDVAGEKVDKTNILRLFVHIEDFSQYFYDDSNSEGRIALRVSVIGKDDFLMQKSFFHKVTAPSPDSAGGAKALAIATDEIIFQMLQWIAENYRKEMN